MKSTDAKSDVWFETDSLFISAAGQFDDDLYEHQKFEFTFLGTATQP